MSNNDALRKLIRELVDDNVTSIKDTPKNYTVAWSDDKTGTAGLGRRSIQVTGKNRTDAEQKFKSSHPAAKNVKWAPAGEKFSSSSKWDKVDEESSSGAAGAYSTPNAFVGSKGRKPTRKGVDSKDFTPVKFGEGAKMQPTGVNESRYNEYRMAEGHPRQKIGKAIREINSRLTEIDKLVRMNARLKNESNLQSNEMWKSTARGLATLEGRLISIANRIREFKA